MLRVKSLASSPLLHQCVCKIINVNNCFVWYFLQCRMHDTFQTQQKIINCDKTLLEVEVDDDIVEKFTVIQTVEILVSHRYSTSSWRRGISKQPAANALNYQYVITN